MKELNLKIKGMHCTGCSTRLERVLNKQDGIKVAKVSFEKGEIDIEFDEQQIELKDIKELIEDAGFEAN